ncbi:MAG: CDP-glycerol glycerophosphotransferase family protein [Candidatus Sumerlaeia bacterium]|nr:CDP-glycerol glycerophosphotransferase family protein [Candidatus Sumerlaeia bacterium]
MFGVNCTMSAQRKRLLFFAKAPNNVVMFWRIYQRLRHDERLQIYFTGEYFGSRNARPLYRLFGMEREKIIGPFLARWLKFDLYLSPDIKMVAKRAHYRVQIYHGISFKGHPYTEKILSYNKLFIVGEDMLRRYIRRGILRPEDSRIEKIGMPKTDPLRDGSLNAEEILARLGLKNKDRPIILFAPTWRPESSIYTKGDEIINLLSKLDVYLLIKLHDLVLDPNERRVNWQAKIAGWEQIPNVKVIRDYDVIPYMFISDVLISDASSVANEFTLLDRPIIFVDVPELFKVYEKTIDLTEGWGRKIGEVVNSAAELKEAVDDALRNPQRLSAVRRQAATDFFYNPGRATSSAVNKIYELLELEEPRWADKPNS